MSAWARILCSAVPLLHAAAVSSQRSSFNGLEVQPADSTGHYRILIGGHFHGESTNRSGYPAATLLANLDTINALGARLFLSTGDLYMNPGEDSVRYVRSLFSKLRVPFFNAPGNHDVVPAIRTAGVINELDIYQGIPKGKYKAVRRDLTRVILLNTEVGDGSIGAEVLERIRAIGASCGRGSSLVIISHRPIWAEDDPQYDGLFKDYTRSLRGTNFRKDVYPVLQEIAKHAGVYWISGSLGGQAPGSIFFQRHAPNITYIQCAIRDEPRDALLIADVYLDSVHWSALSLTGQRMEDPRTYDAAWWRGRVGRKEPFNWRLLPYLVRKTMARTEFWWGAASTLLLVLVLRRLLRRW